MFAAVIVITLPGRQSALLRHWSRRLGFVSVNINRICQFVDTGVYECVLVKKVLEEWGIVTRN